MLISKVKKVYNYELQNKFKKRFEVQEMDYRYRQFFEELCDDGLYVEEYPKNNPKLRITFIPFLICILIIFIISLFKFLFTGTFALSNKNLIIKKK